MMKGSLPSDLGTPIYVNDVVLEDCPAYSEPAADVFILQPLRTADVDYTVNFNVETNVETSTAFQPTDGVPVIYAAGRRRRMTWDNIGAAANNPGVVALRKELAALLPRDWGVEAARFVERDIAEYAGELSSYTSILARVEYRLRLHITIVRALQSAVEGLGASPEIQKRVVLHAMASLKERRIGRTKSVRSGDRKLAWSAVIRAYERAVGRAVTEDEAVKIMRRYLGTHDFKRMKDFLPDSYIAPFCKVACERLTREDWHWQNETVKFAERLSTSALYAERLIPQAVEAFGFGEGLDELDEIVRDVLIDSVARGCSYSRRLMVRETVLAWLRQRTGNDDLEWGDVEARIVRFVKAAAEAGYVMPIAYLEERVPAIIRKILREKGIGYSREENIILRPAPAFQLKGIVECLIRYAMINTGAVGETNSDRIKAVHIAEQLIMLISGRYIRNTYYDVVTEFSFGRRTILLTDALSYLSSKVGVRFRAVERDAGIDIIIDVPDTLHKSLRLLAMSQQVQVEYAAMIRMIPMTEGWRLSAVAAVWGNINEIVEKTYLYDGRITNPAKVEDFMVGRLKFFKEVIREIIRSMQIMGVPEERRAEVGTAAIQQLVAEISNIN